MTDYVKKFDFSDKTVFVLGGSGLIGIEICNAFLQFNAKVVVLDLKKNILIKKFS